MVHRDRILAGILVLTVHWLMLQNPGGRVMPKRPPRPGQRYLGLGVGNQVLEML